MSVFKLANLLCVHMLAYFYADFIFDSQVSTIKRGYSAVDNRSSSLLLSLFTIDVSKYFVVVDLGDD